MDKIKLKHTHPDDLIPYQWNNKDHPQTQIDLLAKIIKRFGFNAPVVATSDNIIIAGHGRILAAKQLGLDSVPVIIKDDLTDEEVREYRLMDNKIAELATDNIENIQFELEELNMNYLNELYLDIATVEVIFWEKGYLAEKFMVPPFSVFDSRQGKWMSRKRELRQYFEAEKGRGDNLMDAGKNKDKNASLEYMAPATSIFDPVLCDILYNWFAPVGGHILDPFAGGCVRWLMAWMHGFSYTGYDIRPEQVEENEKQLKKTPLAMKWDISWICRDSAEMDEGQFDLIFSCPPYGDLEVYSDDPKDISNMPLEEFIGAYHRIIDRCVANLKENRFAIFVVGDYRDKKGFYTDFISTTKRAFIDAGAKLYSEIIYLQPIGSAALRANNQMKMRKPVKTHENILVFYKGDPKKIPEFLGALDFTEILSAISDDGDGAEL